jgi:hypothetical protein
MREQAAESAFELAKELGVRSLNVYAEEVSGVMGWTMCVEVDDRKFVVWSVDEGRLISMMRREVTKARRVKS